MNALFFFLWFSLDFISFYFSLDHREEYFSFYFNDPTSKQKF